MSLRSEWGGDSGCEPVHPAGGWAQASRAAGAPGPPGAPPRGARPEGQVPSRTEVLLALPKAAPSCLRPLRPVGPASKALEFGLFSVCGCGGPSPPGAGWGGLPWVATQQGVAPAYGGAEAPAHTQPCPMPGDPRTVAPDRDKLCESRRDPCCSRQAARTCR